MLLLDTCAILHIAFTPDQLSAKAKYLVSDTSSAIYVSAISAAEFACLQRLNRVNLSKHWRTWFRDKCEFNGWNILPIDLITIEEAYSLPEPIHRDPADRIIVATARQYGYTIITTDQAILDYPHVQSLA
jgi:PIN domain nuclease of toxin-antitoxin system